jgi:hypothetical protein
MGCRHCENWLPEPPVTATEENPETSTQANPNGVIKERGQDDAHSGAEYQTHPGGYGLLALTDLLVRHAATLRRCDADRDRLPGSVAYSKGGVLKSPYPTARKCHLKKLSGFCQ